MKERDIITSLYEKNVVKVVLKEGQQLTGKLIGYKEIGQGKANVLIDSGYNLSLMRIKVSPQILKMKRGDYVVMKLEKQVLKMEPVQVRTMKLSREK